MPFDKLRAYFVRGRIGFDGRIRTCRSRGEIARISLNGAKAITANDNYAYAA